MADDDLLTIRQMCDSFGVTSRALRFYETCELISPLRRGQQRLYDRRDRARLTLILRGKRFGLSLDEIGRLLDMYVPGADNAEQIDAAVVIATRRLTEMKTRHAELGAAIAELERLIERTRAARASAPAAATPPEKAK